MVENNENEPLALQLAKDGVESEAAYRAATEAEKARIQAERRELESKSALETVLAEVDLAEVIQATFKAVSSAALTGQEVGRQKAQRQENHTVQTQDYEPEGSPLRPENAETVELDNED